MPSSTGQQNLSFVGRLRWNGVKQNFVENLKGTMELDFDPAWCLLDRLSVVVGTPTLDKREPEDAQPPEVVDPDARRGCCVRDGRCKVTTVNPGTSPNTVCVGLRLHFVIELFKVENLKNTFDL